MVGLENSGVQVGDRRARRGHHYRRFAARQRRTECRKAEATLIEAHGEFDGLGFGELPSGNRERLRPGSRCQKHALRACLGEPCQELCGKNLSRAICHLGFLAVRAGDALARA